MRTRAWGKFSWSRYPGTMNGRSRSRSRDVSTSPGLKSGFVSAYLCSQSTTEATVYCERFGAAASVSPAKAARTPSIAAAPTSAQHSTIRLERTLDKRRSAGCTDGDDAEVVEIID